MNMPIIKNELNKYFAKVLNFDEYKNACIKVKNAISILKEIFKSDDVIDVIARAYEIREKVRIELLCYYRYDYLLESSESKLDFAVKMLRHNRFIQAILFENKIYSIEKQVLILIVLMEIEEKIE